VQRGTQEWAQLDAEQDIHTEYTDGLTIFFSWFKHRQREEKASLEDPQLCACPF